MMTTTKAVKTATKTQVPTILVSIIILVAYLFGGMTYRYVCFYRAPHEQVKIDGNN